MTAGRRGAGTPVFAAVIWATCAAWFLGGCTRQPPATGATEISSPTPVISQWSSNADVAELVAARSLELVKLPRGASIVAAPVVPSTSSTSDPTSSFSSVYLVDQALWYSVRGTLASVLRYVADHVPPGFTAGGTQGSEVYFNGAPTGQYESPQLAVDAEARSGRVLVEVDATVSWRPGRSAEEVVPDTATTAVLTENGTGGAPTTVRLTSTQSHALAHVFNSMWALSPPQYPVACAMGTTISARFTWPGNELDFVPDCEGIGVLANGVAQSELEDSYDLMPVRDAFFAFAASPPMLPAGPSPNPSSIPPAPSTAAVSPSSTGPRVVLTNADQGRGITVEVGTLIDVNLKASPPTTVDPAVTDDYFVLEPLDFSSDSTWTSQASFRAAAKGNVKLFAMTRPVCVPIPACGAAPVFEFDVTVIARP